MESEAATRPAGTQEPPASSGLTGGSGTPMVPCLGSQLQLGRLLRSPPARAAVLGVRRKEEAAGAHGVLPGDRGEGVESPGGTLALDVVDASDDLEGEAGVLHFLLPPAPVALVEEVRDLTDDGLGCVLEEGAACRAGRASGRACGGRRRRSHRGACGASRSPHSSSPRGPSARCEAPVAAP